MRTALWLEAWSKKIQDEVKRQDVDLWREPELDFTKRPPRATEPMISFPRYFVRDLVVGMHERIADIRKYADPTN